MQVGRLRYNEGLQRKGAEKDAFGGSECLALLELMPPKGQEMSLDRPLPYLSVLPL